MRTYFTNLLKQSTFLILIIVLGSSFKHASKFFAGNYNYYVSPGGDVNGDGYADVLMSVFTSEFGVSKDGKVYLNYGTGSGLTQSPVWTGICTQESANFGEAIANAGDVNADGYADIIIGAPRFSNGEDNEGAVFVYYGSPDGLKKEHSWKAEGNQANAFFGNSVASAGDVNKDGKVKKSEFGIPEDTVVIGTVGRLAEAKGQRYLLEALAVLKDKFPRIRLLIAGDGPLRKELEDYAETLGIKQNVFFLGMRRDIPELLSVMDIFVLPSLWEGLPNALLEAMAGSRSIIVADIPSFREIIDSKDVGILIPPGDSAALAEALRLLLEDSNIREAMGRNAKQRCSLLFDIKAVVRAYTGLFESILKGKENAIH